MNDARRDERGLKEYRKLRSARMLHLTVALPVVLAVQLLCVIAIYGRERNGADPDNFDLLVREDFFAGFRGDAEALARGMEKCEQALEKDPKNAQALVWHGSGLSFDAKKAFVAGNPSLGRRIQAQAIDEMDAAVELRPDSVSVLIPRAAILLSAAMHVPSPEIAKKYFQSSAGDYEKVLHLQDPTFAMLPLHSRGELLGGLAEAWHGLGDTDKSRSYLARMAQELPDTIYAQRAREALATTPKSGALGTTCLGCHVTRAKSR